MCGRYTLIRLADFTDMFSWIRMPGHEVPIDDGTIPQAEAAPQRRTRMTHASKNAMMLRACSADRSIGSDILG